MGEDRAAGGEVYTHSRPYGLVDAMEMAIAWAREKAEASERAAVAAEITEAVMAGSGTPIVGTPVGRHMLWGEVVCLDPISWLRAGLVTNPGCSSSASQVQASRHWSSG